MNPYREAYANGRDELACPDRSVAIVAGVVWAGSNRARALMALTVHERMDAEVALAVLLVIALPISALLPRAR